MGQPKLEINAEGVQRLASMGCKIQEIADVFGCSHDTIERRFASELKKGRADLKLSLRQWQLKAAEKGNSVMQIWLGKQLLGQINDVRVLLSEISDEDLSDEVMRRLERRNSLEDGSKDTGSIIEVRPEVFEESTTTTTDSGQELSKAVSIYRGSSEA